MNTTPRSGRITASLVPWLAFLLVFPLSLAAAEGMSSTPAVPGAPPRVVAVALRDAAIVAWLLPENSSDVAAITSYTISAFDSQAAHVIAATTKARAPGAVVRGLSSHHCYTFSVHANNSAGKGLESERSEVICPLPPPAADIALTMEAPDFGTASAELTFTLTVSNKGVGDAAMVTLVDALPSPLSSYTTTQGACAVVLGGTNFTCNLGAINTGSTATVTLTVLAGSTQITNTAWAKGYDATGTALTDPEPANNTASATVKAVAAAGN